MINLRSQVFATKEQEEQNTKKKKKQAMCSENFQGMSQKKIENKQSDIKLTWSNHKTWFLL